MTEETEEQKPEKNSRTKKMILVSAISLVIIAGAAAFVFKTFQTHSPSTSDVSDTSNVTPEVSKPSDSTYYVITGAFHIKDNVNRCVQKMNNAGYSAELLPGLDENSTRVSVGQFSSRQEAESYMVSVQSSGTSDAWVLAQMN